MRTDRRLLADAGYDTKGNRHADNAQRHYREWRKALLKAEKHRLRAGDHYTKARRRLLQVPDAHPAKHLLAERLAEIGRLLGT